jgi:hypothetical protein
MTSKSNSTNAASHRILLGKDPTETQIRLYENFPAFRGFSDKTLNPEVLEATIVLGLTFGLARDRVFVLAPVAHEDWVLAEFNKVTDLVFNECKKNPNRVRIAEGYGRLFKKLAIMGRLLQFKEEPVRWVSFGFSAEDPIPEWMPQRLLK